MASPLNPLSDAFPMENTPVRPPTWFRVVSVIAVVWMLFGVLAWVMDLLMDESALAQMSEAQRRVYLSRPQWLFVVYAVAVFSGLIGAVGLLLRRGWAVPALGTSLVAVVIQFAGTFLLMDVIAELGAAAALPFPLVIFLIGLGLLMLARHARRQGWLG